MTLENNCEEPISVEVDEYMCSFDNDPLLYVDLPLVLRYSRHQTWRPEEDVPWGHLQWSIWLCGIPSYRPWSLFADC